MGMMKEGQAVYMNPYVTQADRFAESLQHLGELFLKLEEPREQFTEEELQGMFQKVECKVCESCRQREECLKNDRAPIYHLVYELFCTVEKYGAELNVEMKRKLQKSCIQAPRFLRESLDVFGEAKRNMVWNQKMVQSREGCAAQLGTFAQMIRHATRELDASIFADPPLEKKIKSRLRRSKVRILSTVFFVSPRGHYEIHITVKTEKGACMTTKELAGILSACTNRRMCPAQEERPVLSQEYSTIIFVEGPSFYTMQGIARIGRGCEKISGDSFLMTHLPGGEAVMLLSDGMGSGEKAFRESTMVIEMLEELLRAGFPKETALEMINTAFVTGRDEICFSTIDMTVFDLYTGICEFLKAGAAVTFIRRGKEIQHIYSQSLPLGVVQNQEVEKSRVSLHSGDFVIMLTDGIFDALPYGEQEHLLDLIIQGSPIENPTELAHDILEKVLELTPNPPHDDMTVLVAGLWEV